MCRRGGIRILAVSALLLMEACVAPSVRIDRLASDLGLAREVRRGIGFDHVVYRNPRRGRILHVYLEGDGSPWETPTRVARDPTSRNPLMLRLMAQDDTAAAYIGRPCYGGLFAATGCDPAWWTDRRYSSAVVESMGAIIRSLADDGNYRGTVLIGHSGGGTLAMLLAERLEPRVVVTLAGNLDVATWCARHGYSPLTGSMDPARRPPLPASVKQLHVVGSEDQVIPPTTVEAVAARQPNARVLVLAGVDHRHGWEQVWPSILSLLPTEP
jgi:pimeloyl-ACP methyl ester carboxylesterase